MIYLYSFLFAGFMCMIAQAILDNTKLTPGHVTSIFVLTGAFLELFHFYDIIVTHIGGGASVLITSFGHMLTHSALIGAETSGVVGIFTNMLTLTSAGITTVIVFSFIFAIFFKPKH